MLVGAGVVVYAAFLGVLNAGGFRGTAPIVGWGPPVLATLVGAVLVLVAMRRHGDRSLLALVALVPAALFVLLLAAETLGLME